MVRRGPSQCNDVADPGDFVVSYPFVRKNLLVVSASFKAADGSATQPTEAIAVINYRDRVTKVRTQGTVALTFNATLNSVDACGNAVVLTNIWTGQWDSSAACDGIVEWLVYGDGSLQAADQGRFNLLANLANIATP